MARKKKTIEELQRELMVVDKRPESVLVKADETEVTKECPRETEGIKDETKEEATEEKAVTKKRGRKKKVKETNDEEVSTTVSEAEPITLDFASEQTVEFVAENATINDTLIDKYFGGTGDGNVTISFKQDEIEIKPIKYVQEDWFEATMVSQDAILNEINEDIDGIKTRLNTYEKLIKKLTKRPVVKWVKHSLDAIIPTKTKFNAGFDIYTTEKSHILYPNETYMFPTDISSIIENGYHLQLFERGSTGTKGIKQSCGCIDTNYSGKWFVPLTNVSENPIIFTCSGERTVVEDKLNQADLAPEERTKLEQELEYYKSLYECEILALKTYFEEYIMDAFDSLWYFFDHKKYERDFNEWVSTLVFYPVKKAISQAVLLPCYDVNSGEATLEDLDKREKELKKLGDTRGKGALGSSGK